MVIVLYRKGNSFQCDRIIETCALVFDNAFCTMEISRYTVARCTWSLPFFYSACFVRQLEVYQGSNAVTGKT